MSRVLQSLVYGDGDVISCERQSGRAVPVPAMILHYIVAKGT